MKYLFSLAITILIAIPSFSQIEIKLEDISKHIGDSVKVCGKVFGIKYLEQSKNSPTLINLGAAYPNQLLTVVIWGDVRNEFEKMPEELFRDREVYVIGKIELFKEKAEIVIHAKKQITYKE